jgi:hypothetical protein
LAVDDLAVSVTFLAVCVEPAASVVPFLTVAGSDSVSAIGNEEPGTIVEKN